jgi:hypothetical protein
MARCPGFTFTARSKSTSMADRSGAVGSECQVAYPANSNRMPEWASTTAAASSNRLRTVPCHSASARGSVSSIMSVTGILTGFRGAGFGSGRASRSGGFPGSSIPVSPGPVFGSNPKA